MTRLGRLDGKVAIITGAARGQGEAEARLFLAEGASVVLTDVLVDRGRAVAEELGDAARFVDHDVADEDGWARVVAAARDQYGGLDVLVNNAGIHRVASLERENAEAFRKVLDVNVVGTFLGMRAVIGPMREAGGGSIVNISSQAGLQGLPGHGAYGASKWAVRGLTKVAATELGRHGIRVNSVHPGPIDTPMLPPHEAGLGAERFSFLPLRRVGEPVEVAELVLFLASDAAAYLTGAEVAIDGGGSAGPVLPGGG